MLSQAKTCTETTPMCVNRAKSICRILSCVQCVPGANIGFLQLFYGKCYKRLIQPPSFRMKANAEAIAALDCLENNHSIVSTRNATAKSHWLCPKVYADWPSGFSTHGGGCSPVPWVRLAADFFAATRARRG
jgi:hypothetical protein